MATRPETDRRRADLFAAAKTEIAARCWPGYEDLPIRIADVARALGVSPRQLQRVVREVGSTTFRQLVAEARMARAEKVLLSGTLPVSVVARGAGYHHAGHFAKVFKRHRKASPSRLRRKRLGPRRARRIGGLRGAALFEGRLSPEIIRARERGARTEFEAIRRQFKEEQQAKDVHDTQLFGETWPAVIGSILRDGLARLRGQVKALERSAWRERAESGTERRKELVRDIDSLIEEIRGWERAHKGRSRKAPRRRVRSVAW